VARSFFREGQRLLVRAIHLLGSRTVFFVCLLLALTTAFGAVRELWFSRTGLVVEGVVVREVEELTADWTAPTPSSASAAASPGVQTAAATRVYRAVVRFRDKGRPFDWHEVPAQLTSTARLYPVGTKVDVLYPAGAPGLAKLRPELPDIWSQAGLLLMATVLGSGTLYGWWKSARKRAARRRRVVNGAS
jgi:hypothetical protein